MASDGDFFSANQQFRRDFARSFRANSTAFWTGPLYVFAGFYCFQRLGKVQVYDVLAPFAMAALVIACMVIRIHLVEMTPASRPLMHNLPRDRTIWWRAQLAYLVVAIVWLEAWALVGTALKLGGAGIVAHYRLYPEAIALPFFGAAILHCTAHAGKTFLFDPMMLVVLIAAAARALCYVFGASEHRGYNPPRDLSLGWCVFVAMIMIAWSALLLRWARRQWDSNQRGEKT